MPPLRPYHCGLELDNELTVNPEICDFKVTFSQLIAFINFYVIFPLKSQKYFTDFSVVFIAHIQRTFSLIFSILTGTFIVTKFKK